VAEAVGGAWEAEEEGKEEEGEEAVVALPVAPLPPLDDGAVCWCKGVGFR
jgi:hypothetical protein